MSGLTTSDVAPDAVGDDVDTTDVAKIFAWREDEIKLDTGLATDALACGHPESIGIKTSDAQFKAFMDLMYNEFMAVSDRHTTAGAAGPPQYWDAVTIEMLSEYCQKQLTRSAVQLFFLLQDRPWPGGASSMTDIVGGFKEGPLDTNPVPLPIMLLSSISTRALAITQGKGDPGAGSGSPVRLGDGGPVIPQLGGVSAALPASPRGGSPA